MAPSLNDDDQYLPMARPILAAAAVKTKTLPVSTASKKKPLSTSSRENDVSTILPPVASLTTGSTAFKAATGKSASETYQKLSQLEHVLKRPDTYIGSIEKSKVTQWVWDKETSQMVWREVSIVPGLYKILDEVLVNAADNKVRDPSMDTLKVDYDAENNQISVYNNGRGIPIERHDKEDMYIPELIFGNLLTSSNYDDDEKKVTGGRNGYGAKLCNIYSSEFVVETADKNTGLKYKQVWTSNMTKRSDPVITKNSRKEEYTKITFRPDLHRFNMVAFDDDFEALVAKRVYDLAGCIRDIKVFYNDDRIKIKNFKQYIDLYPRAEKAHKKSSEEDGASATVLPPPLVYEVVNDRWEVAFSLSDGQFQQVSFVNAIATTKGGTHVNFVADQLVAKLVETVTKKNKAAPVKSFQVKNHLWVFVNCLIENPAFDSQTKENMTLRPSAFGSKCDLSDDFVKKVLKSGVVENILNFAKFKQDQLLKRTDGHKRSRITGIAKLEDANNAGTRNAKNCTLILTEGDSAKALAVSGLSVVGRDNFGVFPLRGKLLNVREAAHTQIMGNAEIQAIKQIMGFQHGKTYTSVDELRYGKLMVMTDQDHDGSHIKGLIINFLDHFFPSLLQVPGFLVEFITPIVKATKGKSEIAFYTIPEYETWKEQNVNGKGWIVKYFKGLGTSTAADAKRYFSAMDRHRLAFETLKEGDRDLIDMAFNKKKADDRKEWLRKFKPGTFLDHNTSHVPLSDFINKELILFSMADNVRSIPSMVDGLKPGQRKVLFGCFKRQLKGEIKVAQLAGYVSEHSAYHHGEQSLTMTIVGLAQSFVGSNNINLLEPNGQFGTRLQGGKDAASPRYIFTALPSLTRKLFHPADDQLLDYLNDDGQQIEPSWYVPIIPMVLVNGSEGIGTGWSSFVPNYNPTDILCNIRSLIHGRELEPMSPWYRGFSGQIEHLGADKFKVSGTVRRLDATTVEVTELPIRTWTQTYKEMLEGWVTGNEKQPAVIKDYKEYTTDTTVHFVISMTEQALDAAEAEGLEKFFKVTSSISTGNMVCFDIFGRIRKYESPEEILTEFFTLRLQYYQKRKDHLANELTQIYDRLSNQARFIQMIIDRQLIVANRKRDELVADLRRHKFLAIAKSAPKQAQAAAEVEAPGEDLENAGSAADFDYLLSMPIWSLTKEKAQKLLGERDSKEAELSALLELKSTDLWEADLDAFETIWKAMLEADEKEAASKGRSISKIKMPMKPKGVPVRAMSTVAAPLKTVPTSAGILVPVMQNLSVTTQKMDPTAASIEEEHDVHFIERVSVEQTSASSPVPKRIVSLPKQAKTKVVRGTASKTKTKPLLKAKKARAAESESDVEELTEGTSDDEMAMPVAPREKIVRATKAKAATVVAKYIDLSDDEFEEHEDCSDDEFKG